jgi:RimJ/RimL family protein N-acetyltransferase
MSGLLTIPAGESASRRKTLRGERISSAGITAPEDRIPVVFYEGRRIYFRPLELADEPVLRRFINDPANWRTLLHRPPVNAARESEWIESQGRPGGDYVFGIVARPGDRLIGTVSLVQVHAVNRSAVLGIVIGDRAMQGRGYGREAIRLVLKYGFEELNLHRIALSVFADNWRAIRTYQKVGFQLEGCLRQAQYRNGRYQDEYRFAILRSEWEALSPEES